MVPFPWEKQILWNVWLIWIVPYFSWCEGLGSTVGKGYRPPNVLEFCRESQLLWWWFKEEVTVWASSLFFWNCSVQESLMTFSRKEKSAKEIWSRKPLKGIREGGNGGMNWALSCEESLTSWTGFCVEKEWCCREWNELNVQQYFMFQCNVGTKYDVANESYAIDGSYAIEYIFGDTYAFIRSIKGRI